MPNNSVETFGSATVSCSLINVTITKIAWVGNHTNIAKKNETIDDSFEWTPTKSNNATPDPDNFIYEGCSETPAVYFTQTAAAYTEPKLSITIQVDKECGTDIPIGAMGKEARLDILFDGIVASSELFILPNKGDSDTVSISFAASDMIQWRKGIPVFVLYHAINTESDDSQGNMEIVGYGGHDINLEMFVLYDTPANFYKTGVWVEALRFLFEKTGIHQNSNIVETAQKITQYCHSEHGMVYDVEYGSSYFFNNTSSINFNAILSFDMNALIDKATPTSSGGSFLLKRYLDRKVSGLFSSEEYTTVNCFDQTGIVQALCGAVGIGTEWIFMVPYGHIKEANLVGIGECNNPFYKMEMIYNGKKIENEILSMTDGYRKLPFTTHGFIRLKCNSMVLDATIGPYIATKTLVDYVNDAIDFNENNNHNIAHHRFYQSRGVDGVPENMLFPDEFTHSPLSLEIIEQACSGRYKGYKHDFGYPCVGVTDVIW